MSLPEGPAFQSPQSTVDSQLSGATLGNLLAGALIAARCSGGVLSAAELGSPGGGVLSGVELVGSRSGGVLTAEGCTIGVRRWGHRRYGGALSARPKATREATLKPFTIRSIQKYGVKVHNGARPVAYAANPHFMRDFCTKWKKNGPSPPVEFPPPKPLSLVESARVCEKGAKKGLAKPTCVFEACLRPTELPHFVSERYAHVKATSVKVRTCCQSHLITGCSGGVLTAEGDMLPARWWGHGVELGGFAKRRWGHRRYSAVERPGRATSR